MGGRERAPIARRGVSLVRIAGIDVRLDYSWFLIFALILASLSLGYFPRAYPGQSRAGYWTAGALATLLFFLSILIHEFSHAVVARLSGIRVPDITLFLFGGVSHMEDEAHTPAVELRVAAVGPLTSFALAVLFWGLFHALPASTPPLAVAVVRYLAWINGALAVFNLLPGFPLDGGRVLRALAWWRTGSLRRATRMAADAGKGLAIGLMILGALEIFGGALLGGLWLVFIGMFLRSMAESSYQNLVLLQTLEDVTAADVAIERPVSVPSQLSIQRLVDEYLLHHGFRAYPVVDGGTVKGLIAVADLGDLPVEQRPATTVAERMHPLVDAMCVPPDLPLSEALKKLQGAPGGRLLVMRGGELLGLLTKSGLARFVEIRQVLEHA
jgi:Zn-dependent protease/predicted transcriptional regulator